MVKLGFNINLGDLGDRYDKAKWWAIKSNADCHLLMTVPNGGINGANESNEITTWKRDLPASTRILWRTYNLFEGDWVKMLGYSSLDDLYRDDIPTFTKRCEEWARAVVGRWRNEGLQDVYRDDPANEPGLDANNVALNTRYVIRSRALVLEAKKHGFTVCIGAFSVGTPHEDMIDSGVYDPLLEVVDVMSVHEYPSGCVGAGDLFEYEAMLKPKDVWQRLPQAKWAIASQYWLMRRCDRLYLRAKQVHNREIKFIISETNTSEDIPDANHVTGQLRSRYATADCGGDLRGQQAWQNYYAEMFNDHNLSQNVGRITEYMANYVFNVPHIIGVNIFQMGYRWGRGSRGLFRCHSYIEDDMAYFNDHLLPQINLNIKEDTMTEQPDIWKPELHERMVWSAGDSIRMRSAMSTNSAVIGAIDSGARKMLVSIETLEANGYSWHKFKEGDVTGYFADLDILRIEPVSDVPDTPDEPTEPDDTPTDGITQEQLESAVQEAVTAQFEALQAKVTALEAQIADMLTPVIVDVPDVTYTMPKWAIPMKIAQLKGEIRQREAQVIFLEGEPTAPIAAQNIKFPRSTADVHSIADLGFQFNPVPSMDVDDKGNITITNEVAGGTDVGDTAITFTKEPDTDSISTVSGGTDDEPADDTNEQTLTLNGDDSEGDDDSEDLVA